MTRTTAGGPSGPSPDAPGTNGSTVAARWTSGLGAFLMVAAGATFVAVRWDDIPQEAKLGTLLLLTGLCLGADRWLRGKAPVTAATLFHLGVLLVPVDVAAIGVSLGWAWPQMLLTVGASLTAAAGGAGWRRDSVVLQAAAALGLVPTVAGAAVGLALPAHLLLAAVALVTARGPGLLRADRWAVAWASLAGLATPLAGAEDAGWPAAGVLTDLGLASEAPHTWAALTGLVAAAALALVAARMRSFVVALLGVACLWAGVFTTWLALAPGAAAWLVGLVVLLLATEVTAWWVRHDLFWQRPAAVAAAAAELLAAAITAGYLLLVLAAAWATGDSGVDADLVLVAGLLAVLWLVKVARGSRAEVRAYWPFNYRLVHPLQGLEPAAAASSAAAAGVLALAGVAGAGGHVARGGLVAVAGLALLAVPVDLRPAAARNLHVGALLLTWAPVVAGSGVPAFAAGLGAVGSLAVAAAVLHTSTWTGTAGVNRLTRRLAWLSLAPLGVGMVALHDGGLGLVWALAGAIVGAWLLAAVYDRATVKPVSLSRPPALAWVPRLAALLPLLLVAQAGKAELTVAEATSVAGLFGGLALLDALRRQDPLLLVGAGLASWMMLDAHAVVQLAPYLAPVAGLWLLAGGHARARAVVGASTGNVATGPGSWVAYAPAVLLLGGGALLDRLAGGPGWYAVLAGAVAVLAVLVGAVHRLAGPLLAGTALAGAVTLHEILGASAQVPTWAWLAGGGAVLLLAGLVMERRGTGPVETGRRLVDVIGERFS